MVEVGAQEHSCLCMRLLDKDVQHLSPGRVVTRLMMSMIRSLAAV